MAALLRAPPFSWPLYDLPLFRNATVESFLSAAFSSLRLVLRSLTMSSWPTASAQAINVP